MTRGEAAVLERAAASPSLTAGTMGKTEKKRTVDSGQTGQAAEGDQADAAFDLWLKRGLHQLYDTVAKEPIPEEILRLIEEDRAARKP